MRTPFLLALAVCATFASAPAWAEDFTVLIYETPADVALRADAGEAGKRYWAEYAAFGETLAGAGAMRGGAALVTPPSAIRSADGLILGGYFTIAASDRAAAERLAGQAPAVRRGGRAELRPNYPAPAMAR